jgi:hypothetical protein
MEPEGSLCCSPDPSTGPHPEPDQSSPYQHILSLRSISIISTHLRLRLPSGLFLFLYIAWKIAPFLCRHLLELLVIKMVKLRVEAPTPIHY